LVLAKTASWVSRGGFMRRKLALSFLICGFTLASVVAWHDPSTWNDSTAQHVSRVESAGFEKPVSQMQVVAAYGKLPLSFEPNVGQADSQVDFVTRASGYTAFLASSEATVRLDAAASGSPSQPGLGWRSGNSAPGTHATGVVVRMVLLRSNRDSEGEGLDRQFGHSNYLIGNDPSKWQRNVPQFSRVAYRNVYPGVDLVYYGNQRQLESDYVVAPGANPNRIALRIEGADHLALNSQGNLVLSTAAGDVFLRRPRAFQKTGDTQLEVTANYIRNGKNRIGIQVGPYDHQQPLIIDPVLVYSTYLGGTTSQIISGIAVDTSGSAYVTGFTSSTNFPTTAGVLQTTVKNSANTAFVTKLKTDGSGLVYSTLIGGSGAVGDKANAIAIDGSGNAYIVGTTSSTDFPTMSSTAYQSVNKGGGGFFTVLNTTGTSLVYSTYLSGSGIDLLDGVAVDRTGNAYITGSTTSIDFPLVTAMAIQTTNNAPSQGTAFLSRMDPTKVGTVSLIYSTYIGGSKGDSGRAVAVDSNANAYIAGATISSDFPTTATNAGFQTTLKNTTGGNAFVARIDTSQPSHLVYSTFLGGSGSGSNSGDVGMGITLGPSGDAYMIGYSAASNYPLVNAFDAASSAPSRKVVISRINTNTSGSASLVYSTYFGGTTFDVGTGIALDTTGNMYVSGATGSADFPVTPGTAQAVLSGTQNAFIAELNPAGTALLFGTFLGGSTDSANGIALDHATPASVYVAGNTSGNFPITPNAFQILDNVSSTSNTDGFVAKLSPAVLGVYVTPAKLSFGTLPLGTTSVAKVATLVNGASSAIMIAGANITGTNSADFAQTTTCGATLASGASCTYSVTFTPTVTGAETATLSITDNDASSPHTVALSGTGSGSSTPDFTLGVVPSSATVTAGSNVTLTATVVSVNNFTGAVSLTCSGAPRNSGCTLSPTSVTLGANGNQTSTGTIATTARTAVLPTSVRFNPRLRGPNGLWILVGIGLAAFLLAMARLRPSRRFAWGCGAVVALSLTACSGVPPQGTPAGTYTLTVTATSGSLTHSATVSLTVN